MSADTDPLVSALIGARESASLIARPSAVRADFDLGQAYQLANETHLALSANGWRSVGRKLGFTNRATWDEFELATPIWAYVYERTVIDAAGGHAEVSAARLAQPRIEPEIVLGLNQEIERLSSTSDNLADAVEWVAPGFEIVDCHYAGWQFNAADILADFGAHGMLVVGERRPVSDPVNLAEQLANTEVVLTCDDKEIDRGVGSNALNGPLSALRYLLDTLEAQSWATRLAGGEIITTGTLTQIPYIAPGQAWRAAFGGSELADLAIDVR